eukprot:CAMPEP_0174301850 /NCGR_PEP_ID=MMETSP0809-20121228/59291_1 /TAXON_ID=73025 ORGANISM="Eutreptiella gymnastica-like, Strain CCMP1594" /NCGR_SAMPLE_ID=MMETSP0809 /ASSEMBLY_ACC=CAM_ASM_000658 /LENGTH=107 /DNA_ID=CAMNT_0015407671 /DNA_START=296 /DNA_END=619 /DNA_ORIENTATION=+
MEARMSWQRPPFSPSVQLTGPASVRCCDGTQFFDRLFQPLLPLQPRAWPYHIRAQIMCMGTDAACPCCRSWGARATATFTPQEQAQRVSARASALVGWAKARTPAGG